MVVSSEPSGSEESLESGPYAVSDCYGADITSDVSLSSGGFSPEDYELWRKFEGSQPLPGFMSNVLLVFREDFIPRSRIVETEGLPVPKAGLVLIDAYDNEKTNFTKELCRRLLLNKVESLQVISNCPEYAYAVSEKLKMDKDGYGGLSLLESDLSKDVRVTTTSCNYVGVTVVLLLASTGRRQQQAMFDLVKSAYKASKNGVVVIGSRCTLTDEKFSDDWREYINFINTEGDGFLDHFEIVCHEHRKINRTIFSAYDFITQSPLGGCDNFCGELDCGHFCPHVCHPVDRYHHSEKYRCKQPCKRQCDSGHRCKEACWKDCGQCLYVVIIPTACEHAPGRESQVFCYQKHMSKCTIQVGKRLDCGHFIRVACSVDVSNYKCEKRLGCHLPCGHGVAFNCGDEVEKLTCQIPICKQFDCGHELHLTCGQATTLGEELRCLQPCLEKLSCGHFCQRLCHFNDDPKHENYKCMQTCQKFCLRIAHRCDRRGDPHLCFQPCEPCNGIYEYPMACGHLERISCSDPDPDEDTYACKQPCLKVHAFCKHPCTKTCGESCGQCAQLVDKPVLRCKRGHTKTVPCSEKRPTECDVEVYASHKPDCGHSVLVPCSKAETLTPVELAEYCDEPCVAIFDGEKECGHRCRGNCSNCYLGRFHMRCEEPCGKTLICGHCCTSPCGMACPPCRYPCYNICEHGSCEYECGVPCVRSCQKPCPYECKHSKCTRKCFQVCNKKGCNEPCPKILVCGHPCVGFCGEPCPPFCRICHADKLLEGSFSGNTTLGPEDRFIYLPDCGHCVEANDFHNWIYTRSDEILPIRCPTCKTRIIWLRRYSKAFHENYNLIQTVREKISGKEKEIKEILNAVKEKVNTHLEETNHKPYFPQYVEYIMYEINLPMCARPNLSKVAFRSMSIELARYLNWITTEWINASSILLDYSTKLSSFRFGKFYEYWEEYICFMPLSRSWPLHPNEIRALKVERLRMDDVVALYARLDVTSNPRKLRVIISEDGKRMLKEAENLVRQYKPYTKEMRGQLHEHLKLLDSVFNCTLDISDGERLEIVAAFGEGSGRWFKCANGHVYVVTECGGATEVGRCNECGARIGGINHVLVDQNYLATEMDGAKHPLYPTTLLRN